MKVLITILLTMHIVVSRSYGEISTGDTDSLRRVQVNASASNHTEAIRMLSAPGHHAAGLHPFDFNVTNLKRVSEILNVFSVENIGINWNTIESKLNSNCSKDLLEYLDALQKGRIWSLKSEFYL